MIRRYYRKKMRGQWHPRGLVVARTLDENTIEYGFSLSHPKDPFSRKAANILAIERMNSGRHILRFDPINGIWQPAHKLENGDYSFAESKLPFSLSESLNWICSHINRLKARNSVDVNETVK